MKNVKRLLVACVTVYLLMVGYLYVFQRSLIYPSPTIAPVLAEANLPGFDVVKYQTTSGLTLTGWYTAAKKKPTILIFHGNAGDLAQRANFARFAYAQGYGVLLTSYRGYPPNDGTPSEQALYDDAVAAKDFLNNRKIENKNIIVFGASLGSGPATELAARMAAASTPAHTLFLEVPFTRLAEPAAHKYWYVPVDYLLEDKFDNLSKITSINAPLCIMAAGDDKVVPNVEAHELYNAAHEPRFIYTAPGATHAHVLKDNEANFRIALECIEGAR